MNEDIYIMSELHSLMKKLISSMNDINSTTNKNNSWWVKRVAIRNHKFTMNFLIWFSWSWWNILYMKECKSRCLNIICSLIQKCIRRKNCLMKLYDCLYEKMILYEERKSQSAPTKSQGMMNELWLREACYSTGQLATWQFKL